MHITERLKGWGSTVACGRKLGEKLRAMTYPMSAKPQRALLAHGCGRDYSSSSSPLHLSRVIHLARPNIYYLKKFNNQ